MEERKPDELWMEEALRLAQRAELNDPRLNHCVEVSEGVLAGRCMEMLQAFFRERRGPAFPG